MRYVAAVRETWRHHPLRPNNHVDLVRYATLAASSHNTQPWRFALDRDRTDDKRHWIEAGRSYERLALQATALGLCTAFINQPVEVPLIRAQFAAHLGIGARRPDLIIRIGRGPEMPRSLRRPLAHVLLDPERLTAERAQGEVLPHALSTRTVAARSMREAPR